MLEEESVQCSFCVQNFANCTCKFIFKGGIKLKGKIKKEAFSILKFRNLFYCSYDTVISDNCQQMIRAKQLNIEFQFLIKTAAIIVE
jgi:hypothetical protein